MLELVKAVLNYFYFLDYTNISSCLFCVLCCVSKRITHLGFNFSFSIVHGKQILLQQFILSFTRLYLQLSFHSCPVWHSVELPPQYQKPRGGTSVGHVRPSVRGVLSHHLHAKTCDPDSAASGRMIIGAAICGCIAANELIIHHFNVLVHAVNTVLKSGPNY